MAWLAAAALVGAQAAAQVAVTAEEIAQRGDDVLALRGSVLPFERNGCSSSRAADRYPTARRYPRSGRRSRS